MVGQPTLARIAGLIRAKRKENGLGLRAAALASGLSASTLSRLERGQSSSLPDAETLSKLSQWLGVSIEYLLVEEERVPVGEPKLETPDIVRVHLRADKNLSPQTAEALARMFRTLYEEMSRTQGYTDLTP